MAIARGAGTEIIRSAHFEEVDSTVSKLIVGVQHHIYTVLNIIVHCRSMEAAGGKFILELLGYDSKAGTTARTIEISRWVGVNDETFVWNDKFSFNGFEPTDFTGPLDDATKQDAIADQGGVAQILQCRTQQGADNFDVHITYIDQNNE